MTTAARDLLAAFEALPPAEQRQVATEILRRAAATAELPEAALHELAAELFRSYDAEEVARSASPGHPLQGTVERYDRPTDPVAEADWGALQ
jgi:hypothetical protein